MSSRANLIKCTGLETYGSEISRSEGSLKQAKNINVDEKGVMTSRRGLNDYKNPTTDELNDNKITKQLMQYKDSILRHFDSSLEFEQGSGDFQSINGEYKEVREGYRIKYQEANSNLYFTTDEGIKKASAKFNQLNPDMVIDAGAVKAGYAEAKIVPRVGGFLPPQSKVAYRVLFGYKDASNNLIFGTPSSRVVVTNFSESVVVREQSSISLSNSTVGDILDGDFFILNTVNRKYAVYFDITGNNQVIPQTPATIGASFIRVNISGNDTSPDNTAAILANVLAIEVPEIEVSIDASSLNIVLIKSKEEGNIQDISDSSSSSVSVTINLDGSVSDGESAAVEVSGIVPTGIGVEYFYQVYRTGIITVSQGLTIDDIDPGDEMNLVYEKGLEDDDILNGEFSFIDNTPDSFRAESLPLYINQNTGEGALQANDTPPIALDMTLFRNYMFYANTKQRHRLEFTIVSVDDFLSGSTRLIVGNSDITRYYTFVGSAEVQDVTISGNPSDGDSILLSSANNEREYYIYFGTTDPIISGATGYRVDNTGTNEEIAQRIEDALVSNVDFNIQRTGSTLTFTYSNNGFTDGIRAGDNLSNVSIPAPITDGSGELSNTEEGGDVLLSGLISVGQSIDETARSLVKVISKDLQSPVNAYYLSTGEDLPGNILLEAKSLEDIDFYIAIEENSNSDIGDEFTPTIPVSKSIDSFTGNGLTTTIELSGHEYSDGDQVFVGYFKDPANPSDPESFSGNYTISNVVPNVSFEIPVNNLNSVVGFVPEFSSTFIGDVVSDNEEFGNRVYYSKLNLPEAVPTINFIDIGPRDEEIKRIIALRDSLFALKDDGVYVISGTSAPDWSVRLIDNTRIIAPDSAVVLNNQIFCLTEQGITRITDGGVGVISRGIENLIDEVTNNVPDFDINTFGISYENDRAYIMFMPSDESDESATQAFRYNIFERTWSIWGYKATCGLVKELDSKLYLGNGDRNVISKERKNFDRTDFADRDFQVEIGQDSVQDDVIKLSTLAGVDVGDVLLQEQELTINYINNRILVKMDIFDSGIVTAMFDNYEAKVGDNLVDKMQEINDHIKSLDDDNITAKVFTRENLLENTELFIDELNNDITITAIKSYKKPSLISFEANIISIDPVRNLVTVNRSRPYVEGTAKVFKSIENEIEWNYQHYGDPSALKQIRYMTIIFDQNNFSRAIAKFSTDISQGKVEVDFPGRGVAYWGDQGWGDPDDYFGGIGNDTPFRNPVPRQKQRCRYINFSFEHNIAREQFRILGVSSVVRAISDRAYR